MIIIAVDPGLTGALAFYNTDTPERVGTYDMPVTGGEVDPFELDLLIKMLPIDYAYVEQVGPMPRDGVKQAWRFSGAYFTARTVLALAQIPTYFVTPSTWKKAMKVRGGPDGKEECRALAIKMFPVNASAFFRRKDHGRAEAALLALYGSKMLTWRYKPRPDYPLPIEDIINDGYKPRTSSND